MCHFRFQKCSKFGLESLKASIFKFETHLDIWFQLQDKECTFESINACHFPKLKLLKFTLWGLPRSQITHPKSFAFVVMIKQKVLQNICQFLFHNRAIDTSWF